MKKIIKSAIVLAILCFISGCGSESGKAQDDQAKASSEVQSSSEWKDGDEKLLTVENSIMDKKKIQIWYKVKSKAIGEDAKNAKVIELFVIKRNQLAHLAIDSPGYTNDMTVEEYNEKYGTDIQEKEPLTLGEISQLTDTDKIYSEVEKRYSNSLFSMRYDENKPFDFYPVEYVLKTDGSGNNAQEVDLKYVNAEGKSKVIRFMSPLGQVPVYDNVFAGYWGTHYLDVDDPEDQYVTLETYANTRFVLDEVNPDKFEIE